MNALTKQGCIQDFGSGGGAPALCAAYAKLGDGSGGGHAPPDIWGLRSLLAQFQLIIVINEYARYHAGQ